MQSTSILFEQKRAELQVKLTILKENMQNIKNRLKEGSLGNLEAYSKKYEEGLHLVEIKEDKRKQLERELSTKEASSNDLRLICNNLVNEKENCEKESKYYEIQIKDLQNKIRCLKIKKEEQDNRKVLLKQEIEMLETENQKHDKIKNSNDQIHQKSLTQQEFMSEQISNNQKKIQLLQIKIDELNKQKDELDGKLKEISIENEQIYTNNEINNNKIIDLTETAKSYDQKIMLLKRELNETNDYINSSTMDRKKLTEQLTQLTEILTKINKNNRKLNSALDFMNQRLQKKKEFMEREQTYYENCLNEKSKLIDKLKEIDSYKDLI